MEVKGTAVATIPLFVKEKHGENGYHEWLAALTATTRETLGGKILPTAWYPMREMLAEPTRAICNLFYDGNLKGAVEQGRFSAQHGLRGVYRLFVRVASPEYIMAKASQIMPTYYRPSAMIVIEKESGKAVIRITEFPEPDTFVEHRILGWMEQALLICGVKNFRSSIAASMTTGAPHTDFRLSWS
jgi:hypothetical protein